jgi:hypothetical protein
MSWSHLLARFRMQRRRSIRSVPDWPTRRLRPRVLVECPDSVAQSAIERALDSAGYDAVCCDGPPEGSPCALVTEGRCTAVEGADVVVNSLGVHHPTTRDLVRRTKEVYPNVPVLLEATPHDAANHPAWLEGTRALSAPLRLSTLHAGIAEVLDGRHTLTAT